MINDDTLNKTDILKITSVYFVYLIVVWDINVRIILVKLGLKEFSLQRKALEHEIPFIINGSITICLPFS